MSVSPTTRRRLGAQGFDDLVAALVSATDICIPSMIYNALFVRQADLAR